MTTFRFLLAAGDHCLRGHCPRPPSQRLLDPRTLAGVAMPCFTFRSPVHSLYRLRSRSAGFRREGPRYHVAQDTFGFLIFLLPPSKYWDFRCATLNLISVVPELKLEVSCTIPASVLPNKAQAYPRLVFSCPHLPPWSLSSADLLLASFPVTRGLLVRSGSLPYRSHWSPTTTSSLSHPGFLSHKTIKTESHRRVGIALWVLFKILTSDAYD